MKDSHSAFGLLRRSLPGRRGSLLTGIGLASALALTMSSCGNDEDPFSGYQAGSGGSGGSGGDPAGAGGGGSDEPVACPSDIEDLSEAFAEAVCKKRGECCDDDYEVCIAEVTFAMDAIYVDLTAAVENETGALDCDNFDDCAAAIAEANCADWPAQVGGVAEIPVNEPACRKLVTPLVEAGEECSYNYECAGGFCIAEDGTCRAYAGEDEDCTELFCDVTRMFCNADMRCEMRLENGADCTESAQCESGLCDVEDSDAAGAGGAQGGTCVAPGPDHCEYVPAAPATCSVSRSGPGGRTRAGLLLLFPLMGLLVAERRRRRRIP